jgi:flavin-dependent dehydrogenase
VVDVLRDDERVTGVRLAGPEGEYELRAPLVVGADGRNSTIANLVGAPAYLESTNHNAIYWTYFEKTRLFDEDPRYRWGACIHVEGREARAVFQTDSDLVLMGGGGSREVVDAWRADPAASLTEHLGRGRLTAPLLEGSRMVSKPLGVLSMHFFMKQAVGPGWALVGDAGLHIDPTPGLGITDAVRDAVALSDAIVDGSERALHLYWRRRDAESLGLYYFAGDMGSPDYNNAFTRMLFDRGQDDPVVADRMDKMMTREIRPQDMLPQLRVLRWLLAETFSGKLGPLRAAGRMARLRTLIDRQQIAVDRALERAENGVLDWTPPPLLNH